MKGAAAFIASISSNFGVLILLSFIVYEFFVFKFICCLLILSVFLGKCLLDLLVLEVISWSCDIVVEGVIYLVFLNLSFCR